MKLICDHCAATFQAGPTILDGDDHPGCTGHLRPLTRPETILLRRYRDLHRDYRWQAEQLRTLMTPALDLEAAS